MKKNTVNPIFDSQEKESQRYDVSFYKSIAMGGPTLMAIVNSSDLKIVFVNRQFEHYLGYSNEHFESQEIYFTDLLDKRQTSQFADQLNKVKHDTDAQSHFVIYLLRSRSGETRPYYLYASPAGSEFARNIDGDGYYQLSLHPDLSQSDLSFTSFATRELLLEQTSSAKFGTFEWNTADDTSVWSKGAYLIYELDYNLHTPGNPFDKKFIHPSDAVRVEEETKNAIATGADLYTDFKIITTTQHIKVVQCLARLINDFDGPPVFAGSLVDISAQRSVENDLKIKVKELYESNKDLEEFAYIASHDLQEPLRKITTFSDWLGAKYKDVLTGDGAMYLSRMVAAAGNMRSLIDDLLEFSRVSNSNQHFEQVDLNEILLHVEAELELTIAETGTVINCDKLPLIEAIASQMKQLLSNIICNSIKFRRPEVSPIIDIETPLISDLERTQYGLSPDIAYFKLQITDNGIGFENEFAKQIFQVFKRLHGKSDYPGSGIGLAICKKIVERHNGIIYADAVPFQGARFVIIIPSIQQKLNDVSQ